MKTLFAGFAVLCTMLIGAFPPDAHAGGNGFTDLEINSWPRSHHTNDDQLWQFNPRLKSDGSSFLLTWYERYNYENSGMRLETWIARFSNDGAVLDPDGIRLATIPGTYGLNDSATPKEPAVCAANDQYWVFYGDYSTVEHIYGRTIQQDGTVSTPLDIGRGIGLSSVDCLAADALGSGRILAAFLNGGAFSIRYSLVVPPTNVLVNSAGLITNTALNHHIAVSAGSNIFLVAYSIINDSSLPSHGYWATRVDENGVPLDSAPLLIATNFPRNGACDVIPYGDGWFVAYDVGYTNGSIRGRLVSSEGSVSAELFRIEDSGFGRNRDNCWPRVSLTPAADGFQVGYSVCSIFGSDLYTNQYAAVYVLDREFHVRSCDAVAISNSGAGLVLARNDAGVSVGAWTRSESTNFSRRRLMGGLYVPENCISRISMIPDCTIIAQLRGASSNALESTSSPNQPSWTNIEGSERVLDRYPCIATFTNVAAGDQTRFYRTRSIFFSP